MGEKNVTENMIDAIEKAVIRKAESFDAMTSPEEFFAVAELVRAISVNKKVNNSFGELKS